MIFRQFIDYESNTYTYLLASDVGREAILIDPVLSQIDKYVTLLEQLNLKLIYALDTHTHADHITATGKLSQKLNCKIAMGVQSKGECVHLRFKDGEILTADGLKLHCLYTPGHTDDSYCFLMNDCVFTGDTLLIRGTGRTDFQSGDPYQQYDSIFNKLLTLPLETTVFPAHDYNGMTSSTIREEKTFNPRLQVHSAQEYANIMNNLNLAKPIQMDIAIPANIKCGLKSHGENQ